ncbi:MAG: hypothetical protein K5629_01360, partial [Eubacteriales bacterium]|nr:hypothetical protein [Eubacteriales bacterium]
MRTKYCKRITSLLLCLIFIISSFIVTTKTVSADDVELPVLNSLTIPDGHIYDGASTFACSVKSITVEQYPELQIDEYENKLLGVVHIV